MGHFLKAAIAVFLLFSVSGCITFSDRSSARQDDTVPVVANDNSRMDLLQLPAQLSGLALGYINVASDFVVDFVGSPRPFGPLYLTPPKTATYLDGTRPTSTDGESIAFRSAPRRAQ
jgi:hypothetical protein